MIKSTELTKVEAFYIMRDDVTVVRFDWGESYLHSMIEFAHGETVLETLAKLKALVAGLEAEIASAD